MVLWRRARRGLGEVSLHGSDVGIMIKMNIEDGIVFCKAVSVTVRKYYLLVEPSHNSEALDANLLAFPTLATIFHEFSPFHPRKRKVRHQLRCRLLLTRTMKQTRTSDRIHHIIVINRRQELLLRVCKASRTKHTNA